MLTYHKQIDKRTTMKNQNRSAALGRPVTKLPFKWVVGWCDGAGYFSSAGRPTIWITVGQGPTALEVGAGGGCLEIPTLVYPLSPSLWETARYRLNYCLKGPLDPKQLTNQRTNPQPLNFSTFRPTAFLKK